MLWLNKHERIWLMVFLTLLLIAFIGPWGFDRILVPAQYDCSWPNFRLHGDFCGVPLSGMSAIATGIGVITNTVSRMVSGATIHTNLARNPWSLFIILTQLPVFSTLPLLLGGRRRRRLFHAAVWGMALVGGSGFLLWFSLMRGLPPIQLWGLWVYIVLAPSALILEMVLLSYRRRAGLGR